MNPIPLPRPPLSPLFPYSTLFRSFPLLLAVLGLFAFAGAAAAQVGPVRNGVTSASLLYLRANAQNALQLDISTAAGGATVTGATGNNSTGVFSLDFGNVYGLGMGV